MQTRITHTEIGPVVIVAREIATHRFENGTHAEAALAIRYPGGKVPEFEIVYECGGDWMGFPEADIDDTATIADDWLVELLRKAIDWIIVDSDLDLDVGYYNDWADGMADKIDPVANPI